MTLGARTIRGVREMMTSFSSDRFWLLPNSLPMIGMLATPRAPDTDAASLASSSPPMSPVSPSRSRITLVTLRVRNVGTTSGFSPPLTARSSPRRLNSATTSRVMSPLALTSGVITRFTPTLRYWKLVAGAKVLHAARGRGEGGDRDGHLGADLQLGLLALRRPQAGRREEAHGGVGLA